MKGCTGGLGNGRAPGGWLGGGIASRKLIAVIKDIWLPNHAKKVYLAQRHSQEFSCEPNFGGCPPAPLAAPVSSEGNFYNRFTANLPGNLSVKKLCKSVKI